MSFTLLGHAAASVLLSAAPSTPMADVFVDAANASCATGTGTVGSPVCSITTAIGIAMPGDTIRIAPGTYVENVVIGIDLDLVGTGGATVTTIDGGAAGSVVEIPTAVTVTIDGLTITNGLAVDGAGILLGGTLTLTNSTITGNASAMYGNGAGIGAPVAGANLTVTGSTISNNTAYYYGGGIQMVQGSCTITDSTISGNIANQYGGGIYFDGYDAVNDLLTITDSTISNNSVVYGFGGGIEIAGGTLIMSGSTLSGNSADSGAGGAMEAYGGGFNVTNSTFSGNSAGYGGAINLFDATTPVTSLSNVTISNNSSLQGYGGGINNNTPSAVQVRNTLIATNTVPYTSGYGSDTYGPFTSLGYNLIGEGGTGFTNGVLGDIAGTELAPIDPVLGPLQNNGGPTETQALMMGSPALDAGDPVTFEPLDQRGTARPLGVAPDIGAVEGFGIAAGAYCFGDGSGTACPCANNSTPGHPGGCANSAGNGAVLDINGLASVSSDSLNLDLSSASPNSFALLVSGDNQLPQMGACVGCGLLAFDGLRCAGGGFLRHGSRATDSMGATGNGWGPPGGPAGGLIAANGFSAGQTRNFFAFYRENPAFVCQTGQNSSNGISVTFAP